MRQVILLRHPKLTDFWSEYNAFQHLDLRNVFGGGFGDHVIKAKNTTLDVFGGGSSNQEYFAAYSLVTANPTPPPPTISAPQPAITRKSREAVVGEELNTKINSRTTISERFSLYPNVSLLGDYRTAVGCQRSHEAENMAGLAGQLQRCVHHGPAERLERQ